MSEVERSRFFGYLMKQGRLVECRKFILQRISFLSPMEMKFCAIASRKTLIYSIRVWWWRYETIFDYKYYICSVYSFLLRIKFLFQLNYNKPFTRNKRNGKNLKLFAFNCYMQKCRRRISYTWSKIKKRFLNSTLHFPNYERLWACSQFPAHRMTYILSLNFSSEPGFQLRQLLSISFDAISFKDWILLHTPVKLVTWESLSRRSFVNYACIDALSFTNNKDIYWNMKL